MENTEKKTRTAKPFLAIKKQEESQELTLTLKKSTVEALGSYAAFQQCTIAELIEALTEVAVKKDKAYRQAQKA